MRVLGVSHVFPRADDDPSAPFLLEWARALRDDGLDVGWLAPHDAGLPLRHVVGGVPVRRARYGTDAREVVAYRGEMHQLVRSPSGAVAIGALVRALARTLAAQVRRGRPDVLHVHWWVPGMLVTRLAGVSTPVVLTVHGTDVALLEGRPRLAALARRAILRADRVEAVSSDLADRLERATGRAADAVAPMPLAPAWLVDDDAASSPAPTVDVVALGRLVPEKGFGDLVSAASLLDTPIRLVIAGDGPDREQLADQSTALGVNLSLPGRVAPQELRALYRSGRVVAVPSRREGLGLVVAEALLAGAAVVATDAGGTRDLLPPEVLVPVGDVEALADALRVALDDPHTLRRRCGGAAGAVRERLAPAAAAGRARAAYAAVT